ncbi:MAG: LOG family protein [Anaerolineales bacterium]
MSAGRTVVVYAGSAPMRGETSYSQAEKLGRALARAGFVVASGGYIGAMEAVSRGAAEAGGRVIGVTCDQIERWRGVKPNRWLHDEIRCQTIPERIKRLVEIGDAIVVLPGGLGTLSEVALTWALLHIREIEPKPFLLVGEEWRQILDAFVRHAQGYVRGKDIELLTFVPDQASAVRVLVEQFAAVEG